MKTLRHSISALCMSVIMSALITPMTRAYASPSAPIAGADYEVIGTSAPSNIPTGKIEVLDFFSYGNPYDYSLEPKLADWIKSHNSDVIFKRVPVASGANLVPQQRLYHALETVGRVEQLSLKIFEEIQTKNNPLLTPQAQANFVAKEGVNRQKFLSAYNSTKTAAELQKDQRLAKQYLINSEPVLVIQGQYKVSPPITQDADSTIQILDFLVSKARSETVQAR